MSRASGGRVTSASGTEGSRTAFLERNKNVVSVLLDCLEVPALVNTEATVSVMSDKLRKQVSKLVGNDVLRSIRMCTSDIEFSGYLVPVAFVILPLCSHELILGIDLLREHGASISCRTGELSISSFRPADYWHSTNVASVSWSLSLQLVTVIEPSSRV